MLFDSKTGLSLKAWCHLPALILNAEKDWGESGEVKITRGGGRGGLAGVIQKGNNTLFRVCLVKRKRKC